MFHQELQIPKERVAVAIGKKGTIRRAIEKLTGTKIAITKDGDVALSSEDALNVFLTTSIIRAIGRGFNPKIAMRLWSDENNLEIISIKEIIGDSPKKLMRVRSRIIGSEGRARENIEHMTNTRVSIYGKTVAIIGKHEDVFVAKQAIEKLIRGSKHGNVYKYVEKQMERTDQKGFS